MVWEIGLVSIKGNVGKILVTGTATSHQALCYLVFKLIKFIHSFISLNLFKLTR